MRNVTWIDDEPVIGQRVRYEASGRGWTATGSGVYHGVVRSEWDGKPIHFLTDGEINGLYQRCHGFPADGEVTNDLTPTEIMASADIAVCLLVGSRPFKRGRQNVVVAWRDDDPACPCCGHHDLALYADDGEADLCDWWQCETFSGGCGEGGAVVRNDRDGGSVDGWVTQNGIAVDIFGRVLRVSA